MVDFWSIRSERYAKREQQALCSGRQDSGKAARRNP